MGCQQVCFYYDQGGNENYDSVGMCHHLRKKCASNLLICPQLYETE